ncbi:MAG: acyl carrier protein phosphodiesterase [Flavobacteriales bacterium]|nr:acyl carrier protein phosphodiesterase [Flavobacteriales bacterium]
MNHLAHLFLSQSDLNLMVGNYIADHVKGKKINTFSPEIQQGILMHRGIDQFTDEHPIVQKSKERLYPKYRKYAAVLVDMFYDHVLAKNWANYSPIPLETFTQSVYRALLAKEPLFPKSAKLMFEHMTRFDWLFHYSTIEGMQKALNGLSRRATFVSRMEEANSDLQHDFILYEKEFEEFFPQLIEYANTWTKAYD